ncbi:hypothetical protein EYF80_026219 [Liparis tanakae]|uniref:Uncharacterized protein n=1 Tax=Liparis tanakae TaxID=230148 RepID=A0A4Z2HCF3_9TELE|nr:hypothetical protein EYF80_026219 [Liparis tanakae]
MKKETASVSPCKGPTKTYMMPYVMACQLFSPPPPAPQRESPPSDIAPDQRRRRRKKKKNAANLQSAAFECATPV